MIRKILKIQLLLVLMLLIVSVTFTFAAEKILLSVTTDNTKGLEKDTLYSMNPDGTEQKAIYDFKWNSFTDIGVIYNLFLSNDGKKIFFTSDNGNLWTPVRRNIFSLNSDGTGVNQLTPLLNSGSWSKACTSCGKVIGLVKKNNGDPWGGAPLFLEGMQMKNAGVDGSFSFENVPPGVHNLVVYRPGQSDAYTFFPVNVKAGITSNVGILNPDQSGKVSFSNPKQFGNYVYYLQTPKDTIYRMDLTTGKSSKVYTTSCFSIQGVSFDINQNNGKILISDYDNSCTGTDGLYVANADGSGLKLLANFGSNNWCGSGNVAWSPDGSKIAVTACYNYNYGLVILDATTLQITGQAWMSSQSNVTFTSMNLYGWSPKGDYLLYAFWPNKPDNTYLYKINVASMEAGSPVNNLLFQGALNGAVWGNVETPDVKPAPTMTTAVFGLTKLKIGWSKVPGATGYDVYFAPYPDAKPINKAKVGASQTNFSFDIPYGTAYYMAVMPVDANGSSSGFGLSNVVQFIAK